ncbi:MAG TPA: hypothetical protein VFN56_02445 [Candidatus Saccharimonadales bacterium]|nr:hypothetical protein [Candidatus Saccharimonadales bacterium]
MVKLLETVAEHESHQVDNTVNLSREEKITRLRAAAAQSDLAMLDMILYAADEEFYK